MTDKPRSPIAGLRLAIAIAAVVNLAGTGLFVWTSAHARHQLCERVAEAFDAYTDALAEVSRADAARVAEFRAAYETELEDCA